MKITFSTQNSNQPDAIILTCDFGGKLAQEIKNLKPETVSALSRAIRAMNFKGDFNETLHIPGIDEGATQHLFLKGRGAGNIITHPTNSIILGKSLSKIFNHCSGKKINITVPNHPALSDTEAAAHMAFGLLLNSYAYLNYKSGATHPLMDAHVHFIVSNPQETEARFKNFLATAKGEHLSKDLANEPPNSLTPAAFAKRVQDNFKNTDVKVTVLNEKEMKARGMHAHLAVGQGSKNRPCVVIMEYKGAANRNARPLAIVGKGVTFDSGGLSIKSGGGPNMKFDMCGAAATVGAIKTLSQRKARTNVVAIVPLAENMPSHMAYRPDDVLKSMSGKTIEINNTDAEGRLLLCDSLTLVQRDYNPDMIIDIATLTGHVSYALGDSYAGLFTNDDHLAAQLIQAGADVGQELWNLPTGQKFKQDLRSSVADICHRGGKAGASTAATFLQEFVDPDRQWAHLDIAGVAYKYNEATGFGVRLLDRFIEQNREDKITPTPKKTATPKP